MTSTSTDLGPYVSASFGAMHDRCYGGQAGGEPTLLPWQIPSFPATAPEN
jgi:hypothetical protein